MKLHQLNGDPPCSKTCDFGSGGKGKSSNKTGHLSGENIQWRKKNGKSIVFFFCIAGYKKWTSKVWWNKVTGNHVQIQREYQCLYWLSMSKFSYFWSGGMMMMMMIIIITIIIIFFFITIIIMIIIIIVVIIIITISILITTLITIITINMIMMISRWLQFLRRVVQSQPRSNSAGAQFGRGFDWKWDIPILIPYVFFVIKFLLQMAFLWIFPEFVNSFYDLIKLPSILFFAGLTPFFWMVRILWIPFLLRLEYWNSSNPIFDPINPILIPTNPILNPIDPEKTRLNPKNSMLNPMNSKRNPINPTLNPIGWSQFAQPWHFLAFGLRPGVKREWPWQNRKDYFDSKKQVPSLLNARGKCAINWIDSILTYVSLKNRWQIPHLPSGKLT